MTERTNESVHHHTQLDKNFFSELFKAIAITLAQ